ncbi:MAG: hypothetical protein PHV28_16285, partial [Kiritimatiellae bacterium]|nr:hypothetical protein [Kiritimatiellia bacterium]
MAFFPGIAIAIGTGIDEMRRDSIAIRIAMAISTVTLAKLELLLCCFATAVSGAYACLRWPIQVYWAHDFTEKGESAGCGDCWASQC